MKKYSITLRRRKDDKFIKWIGPPYKSRYRAKIEMHKIEGRYPDNVYLEVEEDNWR